MVCHRSRDPKYSYLWGLKTIIDGFYGLLAFDPPEIRGWRDRIKTLLQTVKSYYQYDAYL